MKAPRTGIVVFALIFAYLYDSLATLYILRGGPDIGRELNPVISWVYGTGGTLGFLIVKFGYFLLVATLAWNSRHIAVARLSVLVVTTLYLLLAVAQTLFLVLHWSV